MKRFTSLFLFFFILAAAYAQDDLKSVLPVDPKIRTGVLPNGMKYYVRYNKKPEKRAELRLAVNVGSTAENDDQQGLAHLTEHMAFNGTKNFKKSELVDYLESIGTKFGPDLNAYTSFDETVYMIQLPTDTPSIMQKGLQILDDWAHSLSHDSVEIEKERGVVVEEWRLGQGADERMRRKYWPVLFKDSRYAERLPIGKKEIIEGCKQSTLKQFYYDWYRPDLMCVAAVGDFDIDQMEKMIKEKFSAIPPKQNERPLKAWDVPDTKDLMVATATDKEARFGLVELIYKHQKEEEKTVGDYRRNIVSQLYTGMLGARMSELQRQANPPFMGAFNDYGRFVRAIDAYTSEAICKEDGIEKALMTLVEENERVRRFGFTSTELERQKSELLRRMEKSYNEREKTESRSMVMEYVRNFLDAEPIPGIEFEYNLYKKYLAGITLAEVNGLSKEWINEGTNADVIITAPDKPTLKMPSEERIREIVKGMHSLDVKPYEDKVVNKPLVEKKPVASKVVETKEVKEYGITEWKLANGARIILKPTDFKNDEILFAAAAFGGTSLYPDKDYLSAAQCASIIDESGLGEFDASSLEKMLTGKIANVSPSISEVQQSLNGNCAPKDLETMMQMLYQYFMAPRKDATAFQSLMEKQKGFLQNRNSDPNTIFRDSISYAMSQYNYRFRPMTMDVLKEVNLDRAFEIYKERFSDASGFTFFFVGNFKPEEIKPLVETYIGGLPAPKKNESWKDLGITPPKGMFERTVKKGIEPKSAVRMVFTMPFEYNRNNRNDVNALMKLVNIKLRESLREDKSGVYGVSCQAMPKHYPRQSLEVTISFGCAPKNVDSLILAANEVLDKIRKDGCDDKNLIKVKEGSLRERESGLKENQFWIGVLNSNYMNGENILDLLHFTDYVNSLKGDDFKKFAGQYLRAENYAKFVLMPEK
ncbi:MAG: insulinase family protein [Bacteroidetes bacterium]|nr:insulinase family protein [Bacteroidota bacterium]